MRQLKARADQSQEAAGPEVKQRAADYAVLASLSPECVRLFAVSLC